MRRWQIMPKFEICGQLERIAIFHLVFALMLWFKKKTWWKLMVCYLKESRKKKKRKRKYKPNTIITSYWYPLRHLLFRECENAWSFIQKHQHPFMDPIRYFQSSQERGQQCMANFNCQVSHDSAKRCISMSGDSAESLFLCFNRPTHKPAFTNHMRYLRVSTT